VTNDVCAGVCGLCASESRIQSELWDPNSKPKSTVEQRLVCLKGGKGIAVKRLLARWQEAFWWCQESCRELSVGE